MNNHSTFTLYLFQELIWGKWRNWPHFGHLIAFHGSFHAKWGLSRIGEDSRLPNSDSSFHMQLAHFWKAGSPRMFSKWSFHCSTPSVFFRDPILLILVNQLGKQLTSTSSTTFKCISISSENTLSGIIPFSPFIVYIRSISIHFVHITENITHSNCVHMPNKKNLF